VIYLISLEASRSELPKLRPSSSETHKSTRQGHVFLMHVTCVWKDEQTRRRPRTVTKRAFEMHDNAMTAKNTHANVPVVCAT